MAGEVSAVVGLPDKDTGATFYRLCRRALRKLYISGVALPLQRASFFYSSAQLMSDQFAKKPLLIIDDDRKLCRLIKDYLDPLGYEVAAEHSGPEGLRRVLEYHFEAVILDVMLPGMDGFEVLREMRKKTNVPVLMLTARGEEPDRIVGLEIGADDYLPKTFSTRELLARLRAVVRRSSIAVPLDDPAEQDMHCGDLCVNEATHTITVNAQVLVLTALEFALLASLMRSKGRVKTREQLLEDVVDREFEVFDRSIDVHISALRKKLQDDPKAPRYIRTIRAVGYQLINPDYEALNA